MSTLKFTLRRKIAVAATALTAGVALPIQAGVAHASTPEEDLTACITMVIANPGDDLSANIDACVSSFLTEIGIDPSTGQVDTTTVTDAATPTDATTTNTAILGTVDDGSGTVSVG